MLVCKRDVLILQCRQWSCDLAHPSQRLIPAALSRSGHESIVGLGAIILPPSLVHIILGLFQGQLSSLAFRVLCSRQPIQCIEGGSDGSRLQSLQDGGCNRLVHAEAPEAQTG